MVSGVLDRREMLPPDPSSVRMARRFVTEALESIGADEDVVMSTELLTSEVVTNAVLHAGTDFEIHVIANADGARVEVIDGLCAEPTMRDYDDDSGTGRGLELLEAMSAAWGSCLLDDGKVVWFDVGVSPEGNGPVAAHDAVAGSPGSGVRAADRRTCTVHLVNAPVQLLRTTIELGDALLREMALLGFAADEVGAPVPHRIPDPGVGAVLAAADAAGPDAVELVVIVDAGADQVALARLALLDEAERLASEGELLSLPSLPEIRGCRRWLLSEIAHQVEGDDPEPWTMPEPDEGVSPALVLASNELPPVPASGVALIVAGLDNRIVHADGDTLDLLGWTPAQLVGRRLTTIVPAPLREAHLVGFTRWRTTGEMHIIGRPIEVAAVHADGTHVPVVLQLRVIHRGKRPVAVAGSLERRAPSGSAVWSAPVTDR